MHQHIYDDPAFFASYSQMARSRAGLEAAGEWPAFRALLPDLREKRVLDLGCGFGWHCRYAREQQAHLVIGIDLSEKMIAQARASTADPAIEYRQMALEEIDFPPQTFDVVISSLALHYIEHFALVCQNVYQCLVRGGTFVFSIEHPIFTACAAQDWHYDQQGQRLHWPVDHYQDEGPRLTRFLGHDVPKYHRTLATHLNTLRAAGFTISGLAEPQPTPDMLAKQPEMRDEMRRPMFLVIAALRPGTAGASVPLEDPLPCDLLSPDGTILLFQPME
jgi:SAM-dependent methyltransferase